MNIHTKIGNKGLYVTDCIDQEHLEAFFEIDGKQHENDMRNYLGYRFESHIGNKFESQINKDLFKYLTEAFCSVIFEYINQSNKNVSDYLFPDHFKTAHWKLDKPLGPHKDSIEYGAALESIGPRPIISSLAYLTDNYEGGEIYFPDFDISLRPSPGSIIVFDSDTTHGVNGVISGTRKTMSYNLHSINSPHIEDLKKVGYHTIS